MEAIRQPLSGVRMRRNLLRRPNGENDHDNLSYLRKSLLLVNILFLIVGLSRTRTAAEQMLRSMRHATSDGEKILLMTRWTSPWHNIPR